MQQHRSVGNTTRAFQIRLNRCNAVLGVRLWPVTSLILRLPARLRRIIRELEAKSEQRTNLSAVALTVHESTARELATLKAEIENERLVDGTPIKDWEDCAFPGCENKRCARFSCSPYCYPHSNDPASLIIKRVENKTLDAEVTALRSEIENAPWVYGDDPQYRVWTHYKTDGDTHRAKLLRIEVMK